VLQAEGLSADENALTVIARHADGGMRDALSVLDQCLSFGGDGVTAERVREVLGLVSDDLYAEALTLVADRNPAAVFPLVDRLMDAGADLAEFIGGLGEVLRAMLMAQLGAEPEDLTESLRQTVDQARQRLAPEDTVRMLRLLAETETAVRRSGNPRLTVETLLLRWAMMDRMVDLERVLAGGEPPSPAAGAGATAAPRAPARTAAPPPAASRRSPAATTQPAPEPAPPPVARVAPAGPVAFTLEGVRAIWPELVEVGRQESMFLGQALSSCEIASVAPPVIRVMFPPEHGILAGAVAKGRSPLEAWLQNRLGGAVSLQAEEGVPAKGGERPKRLSQATLRAERLEGLRTADPALDAAVDELDLEILDESPGGGR
jgi:DNA polymerase-3 subunit gamma/tau